MGVEIEPEDATNTRPEEHAILEEAEDKPPDKLLISAELRSIAKMFDTFTPLLMPATPVKTPLKDPPMNNVFSSIQEAEIIEFKGNFKVSLVWFLNMCSWLSKDPSNSFTSWDLNSSEDPENFPTTCVSENEAD